MQRVYSTLDAYKEAIDAAQADKAIAVLTSAVRDAANGAEFTETVRERYRLDAHTIVGDEEARLTFLGATSERDPSDTTPLVVIDIGGGSTELVVGAGGEVDFHVSTQAGVVRQTERHIHTDPPTESEIDALAREVRRNRRGSGSRRRHAAKRRVRPWPVAGTATSLAAIDQELEPYDPTKVHGYELTVDACRRLLRRLAAMGRSTSAAKSRACIPTARRRSWPASSSCWRCSPRSASNASRSPSTTSCAARRSTPPPSRRMFYCRRGVQAGAWSAPGPGDVQASSECPDIGSGD